MTRFWLIIAVVAAGMTMLTAYGLYQLRANLVEQEKAGLRNTTEAAVSLVEDYRARAASGELATDDAKTQALAALATYRFGDDGYFFVFDEEAVMQMHPIDPGLIGKDLTDLKDPNGTQFVNDLVEGRQG